MNIESPILVVGVPRSGTSVIAGTLAACGVWTGHTIAGSPPNPKGWFENPEIKNRTNKAMLAGAGYDPLGQDPLPPEALAGPLPDISDILDEQGYRGGPWLFKDPKTLLCWRAWDRAFPEARWIVTCRKPANVKMSWNNLGWSIKSIAGYESMQVDLLGNFLNKSNVMLAYASSVWSRRNITEWLSLNVTDNFFDPALFHA